MNFKVHKRKSDVKHSKYTKTEIDIAYNFSKEAWHEFDKFLRSIVLFGSSVRSGKHNPKSDIDILLIVDDVSFIMTPEVVETYKLITEKLIAKTSRRLHITTLKFTTFWEYIRIGDPVGINILRDGVALIDTGFFSPLQLLLAQGRIRPTKEAIVSYYSRVPQTLHNSKWHIMQGALDLYWAGIDSAHAALMKQGVMPENPSRIADLINEHLVLKGKVNKKCVDIMKELYLTSKKILHRDTKELSGKKYDKLGKDATFLVTEMRKCILKKNLK